MIKVCHRLNLDEDMRNRNNWNFICYQVDKNYKISKEPDIILLLNQLKTTMWDRKEPIQSLLNTKKLILGRLAYKKITNGI